MSTYDLEEQEQLAELKAWWKQNGGLILTAITLALLVVAGWNGWNWYQNWNSRQAAVLYETLQRAAQAGDTKAVRETAGAILEKYSGTAYGPLAALVSAKGNYAAGDLKTARAQLQWTVDHAKQDEVRSIARLRLASVLMDDNALEEALKVLDAKSSPGFESLFAAERGDILVALKKPAEAKVAYQEAMKSADSKDGALRESLQLKLDALGES